MPVADIVAIFSAVSTGFLAIGAGAVSLTLVVAGLCTMFGWLDQHIGAFVKRVFVSVLLGGSMMGGGGALGVWFAAQLHLA